MASKNYLVYISIPLLKKRLLTPPLVESKCACYETLYVKHESFEYPSTTSHPRKPPHRSLAEKELLCKIFLHFKGSELIELKRLIDAAGGGHDLRHAVYSVITYEVRKGMVRIFFKKKLHGRLQMTSPSFNRVVFGTGNKWCRWKPPAPPLKPPFGSQGPALRSTEAFQR